MKKVSARVVEILARDDNDCWRRKQKTQNDEERDALQTMALLGILSQKIVSYYKQGFSISRSNLSFGKLIIDFLDVINDFAKAWPLTLVPHCFSLKTRDGTFEDFVFLASYEIRCDCNFFEKSPEGLRAIVRMKIRCRMWDEFMQSSCGKAAGKTWIQFVEEKDIGQILEIERERLGESQ